MPVVLEQFVTLVRERVECTRWVRSESRVRRHVLRPDQHVDRVDLDRVQTVRDATDIRQTNATRGARLRESLRAEREPSRFVGRE